MNNIEVVINQEKERTIFILVISTLPIGFVRNESTLKFLCMKFNEELESKKEQQQFLKHR